MFIESNQIDSIDVICNFSKLNFVKMNSNNIISIEVLSEVDYISYLTLDFNQIMSVLDRKLGKAFRYLKSLDFRHNQLAQINPGSFSNYADYKLENLILSDNSLRYLRDFTYFNLKRLISLNLDNNYIELIETMAFDSLNSIKTISLRNNKLKFIFDFVFSYFNITENSLDLSKNNITRTELNSFRNVIDLIIDYPSISYLNYDLEIGTLDLSQKKISVIRRNSLSGLFTKLDLKNNIITTFEPNSLTLMWNLFEIDLSKNLLKNLDFQEAFDYSFNLYKITFDQNKILTIQEAFFEKLSTLIHLSLSNNELHFIKKTYFKELRMLEHLNLSYNQILTFEEASFETLYSLKTLDLKSNLIYDLGSRPFFFLSHLEWLCLGKNKLERSEKDYFDGMSSLKYLDLSENKISYLTPDDFSLLDSLEVLLLSMNQIWHFNRSLCNLESLQYLDVSLNKLKILEQNELENSTSITGLDLSQNQFENISIDTDVFRKLKVLRLKQTNLRAFTRQIDGDQLEEVDLSESSYLAENTLSQRLTNLKRLNLKGTHLRTLGFMKELDHLEFLDLSNNELGSENMARYFVNKPNLVKLSISNVSLVSLKKIHLLIDNLEYLDVSSNSISIFELAFIERMANLNYLDISHNTIRTFDDILRKDNIVVYFKNSTTNLLYIDFTSAFDSRLAHSVFYFGKKLEIAILSRLKLSTFARFCVEDEQFYACQLKTLYFDSNHIETVKNVDLMYLEKLEYLNLDNNLIGYIETESFKNLVNLETLILSRNQLVYFNETRKIFNYLTNLKYLNLSANRLAYIESYLFDNLYKLKIIDLSFNRIFFIQSFAFNKLTNLKDLYINFNEPTIRLELDSFSALDSLENIYLSKSMLSDANKFVFKVMIGNKNSKLSKHILRRAYFKSVNLLALNEYDCGLTLSFIVYNLHFNLKSDEDFYQYFIKCEHLYLPKSKFSKYFIKDAQIN